MFKLKIKPKAILTICLIFFGTVLYTHLNLLPAGASSSAREWKPPGTLYSSSIGLHLYKYTVTLRGKYGVYDDRGFIIYYPQFENIVEIPSSNFALLKNGLWGVMDSDGVIIIPIEYDEIKQLTYLTSRVKKNGLYGWINQHGHFVKTPQYSYLENMGDKFLSACIQNQGCGILSLEGEEILPLTHDGVIGWHNNNSYFSIFKNGKYGVIDTNGNQIIDAILPPIKTIKDDIIITQNGKLEGLVRLKDGKTLLEPVYQNIVELNQEGYYKMKSNGKWGAVDIDGNIIYPCKYGPLEIGRMVKSIRKVN